MRLGIQYSACQHFKHASRVYLAVLGAVGDTFALGAQEHLVERIAAVRVVALPHFGGGLKRRKFAGHRLRPFALVMNFRFIARSFDEP